LNSSIASATCSSSLRYKTQVQPFLGGLNILNRLAPSVHLERRRQRDLGLAAEQVAQVEPLLTFRNKQGEIEGVKYNQLTAVFVNAIKDSRRKYNNSRYKCGASRATGAGSRRSLRN